MYTLSLPKRSVTQIDDAIVSVTIGLIVHDGTTDVLSTEFSVRHNLNSGTLTTFQAAVRAAAKAIWDRWAAEQAVYHLAALDTALTAVETVATAYINS